MPLKFTHRNQDEVATPTSAGKVNEDLAALKVEMQKLASGTVLEIETGGGKAVRGTKMLITKAGNQLGKQVAALERWLEGLREAAGDDSSARTSKEDGIGTAGTYFAYFAFFATRTGDHSNAK